MRKKMSLATLRSFYGYHDMLPSGMRGSPDTRTPATQKGHIHKVGVQFKSITHTRPAIYRQQSKKRNRVMKERIKKLQEKQ